MYVYIYIYVRVCVDVIYDKPCNESFKGKIETVLYAACLVITKAIGETSRECINRKLALKALSDRRMSHNLFFFIKLSNNFPLHFCKKF